MDQCPPIRIVRPPEFGPGATQTPGSLHRAAVAPQRGIQSALWGGLFEVKPGARTGIDHHGEQQTIAYVLSGLYEIRWGARGEYTVRESRGFHPFVCIPAAHADAEAAVKEHHHDKIRSVRRVRIQQQRQELRLREFDRRLQRREMATAVRGAL